MTCTACLDLGGTAIKYGIVDETGRIVHRRETESNAWLGGPALMEKVFEVIEELQKEYELAGISLTTPGVVDADNGIILVCGPNIPNYSGMQVKELLEQKFEIPAEIENDVNCAAMAEAWSGAAKEASHALVMTIGTGIGGCYIADKKVLSGCRGAAAEVGFMPFKDSFFENYGSAAALSRNVAARKNDVPENWPGRKIFEQADRGDPVCCEEIDALCSILGEGISVIASILNPDVIVLGGGILARHELLIPKIQAVMKERMLPFTYDCISIKPARYENSAGMLGAYYNFKSRHPEI
ncbi:MAG: ROK family protein [Erysipelotrichaceae bacterium]|nr:ROK family protein [Erysipelotrichaceae bacterium]